MTKTIDIGENLSIKTVVALTQNGDEVILEENGEPLAKVISVEKPREIKQRIAGLGKGKVIS